MAGWAAAVGLLAAPAPAGLFGGDEQRRIDRAIREVYPALVRIAVVTEEAEKGRMSKLRGAGSGTIIDKEGHIITNHHVAGRARRLVCRMPDGEEIPAVLVGTDPLADIAIIRLDLAARKKAAPLPVARFGDSTDVAVGEVVLAMGSPGGVAQSVTRGIVSNTALILPRLAWPATFRLDGEDVGSLVRWIAHDAQISPGNSGGPLVNLRGEIVGINEVGVAGLGGAIPGNLARAVARDLIERGEVRRSWTGIEGQPRPRSLAADRGVLVGGVVAGSPAEQAGMRAGDVLTEYNGEAVDCRIPDELPVFNRLLLTTPIGSEVTVRGLRDGKPMDFKFRTTVREPATGKDVELKEWGITVRELTLMSALENRRPDKKGALVSSVRTGGPAVAAEPALAPGDLLLEVEGVAIEDAAALRTETERLTRGIKEPRPVLAAFDRGTSRFVTVVKIGGEIEPESPTPSRKPEFPVVLQTVNADLAKALGLPDTRGARIAYVIPGRSAERAGFKVGDVLLAMDGDAVRAPKPEDVTLLMQQVRQYRIGSELKFEVWRDRGKQEIALKLEESSDTAEEPARYKDLDFEMTVREIMSDDRVGRQIPDEVKGVLIERVEPASWAQLAAVMSDDILIRIDGQPTTDVQSVERIFKKAAAEKRKRVVFFVRRGIHTLFLELEPKWDGDGGSDGGERANRKDANT